MDDSANPRIRAIATLSEMFLDVALGSQDFACLEFKAIDLGHECIAEALDIALEASDARLLSQKPEGLHVHDIRDRALATEVGDASSSIGRYRDQAGCDVYLLVNVLARHGSRVMRSTVMRCMRQAGCSAFRRMPHLLHPFIVTASSLMPR